jgi:uncharacterized surface protein with fasciclin (FAS1) repeats
MNKDLPYTPLRCIAISSLAIALTACGGGSSDTDATNLLTESFDAQQITREASDTNTFDSSIQDLMTVVDVAVADGRFTTLVTALEATGLVSVLDNPEDTFTVFAPTDTAFAQLPDGTLETLLSAEGLDTLSDILLYHVVSGLDEAVPADLAITLASQGEPSNRVEMANGDTVTLTLRGAEQSLFVNDSKVIITDVITDNGIIHVLDAVLSPPEEMMSNMDEDMQEMTDSVMDNETTSEMNDLDDEDPLYDTVSVACEPTNDQERSVFQAIVDEPDLTALTAALERTDLDQVLRNVFAEGEYTVFAPTDSAFTQFLSSLDVELSDLDDNVLRDVLLYHVLGIKANADTAFSIASQQDKTQRIIATLNGDAIQLTSPDSESLFVNTSKVVCTDFEAKNGIIHKIDAVLQFPTDVDIVHVSALKPELSTFYDLVKLTDLDHLLRASQEVTVLAPNNDAFGQLPQATLDYLVSDAGRDDLIAILKQHIIVQQPAAGDERILFTTAIKADGLVLATGAEGVSLTVSVNGNHLSIGGANVIDPDHLAENGVIHVIDSVIVNPH